MEGHIDAERRQQKKREGDFQRELALLRSEIGRSQDSGRAREKELRAKAQQEIDSLGTAF